MIKLSSDNRRKEVQRDMKKLLKRLYEIFPFHVCYYEPADGLRFICIKHFKHWEVYKEE